jgi:hypothetical protein
MKINNRIGKVGVENCRKHEVKDAIMFMFFATSSIDICSCYRQLLVLSIKGMQAIKKILHIVKIADRQSAFGTAIHCETGI